MLIKYVVLNIYSIKHIINIIIIFLCYTTFSYIVSQCNRLILFTFYLFITLYLYVLLYVFPFITF